MSDQTAAAETAATEGNDPADAQPKATETVDFWKQKARDNEKRAKANADAAKRLEQMEESQKTEAEKAADRIAKAEAEVEAVPARVAEALRAHLITLHDIDDEDAVLLSAQDPETLLKQASRLLDRSTAARKGGAVVPREGTSAPAKEDEAREFARRLFSKPQPA